MAGLQCHKLLWWMVHEPTAPELELDDQAQSSMDRGTRVGEIARSYVPGGVVIDLPHNAYDERVAITRQALEDHAPVVYEAAFRAGGVFVAVDILKRDGRSFRLIEVKSTTSVKDHHISDVAVQAHVLRQHVLDHVSTLYAMRRRALELDEQGYRTIYDLPEDVPLGPIADRQRRAVQEGRMIVEPTLARALDVFVPPIAFLDFETVGLAVPIWEGCHPYDAAPVQFSCHVQEADGRVTHHEWLAGGPEDPRPALAERLFRACEGARTVVAYNAGFERRCIEQMAETSPALDVPLRNIAARLVDLLPVVRNHVYHPDFGGSFGLKSVLPTLVPELSYDGMAIADGGTASLELERLLFNGDGLEAETRKWLRSDLRRYCHQDTWGLVALLSCLRKALEVA